MSLERFSLDCRKGLVLVLLPFGWLVYLLWFWFHDSQEKTALTMVNYSPRVKFVYKIQCFHRFLRPKKKVQRVLVLNLFEISKEFIVFIELKIPETRFTLLPSIIQLSVS